MRPLCLIIFRTKILSEGPYLTALVRASHRSDDKKYVALGRQITDALNEEKRSRFDQSTLRIKDFKYGSSFSIFVRKNNKAQRSQSQSNFPHDNNTTAGLIHGQLSRNRGPK